MRRAVLDLLQCPRCVGAQLRTETDGAELLFGPLRCPQCHASFPIAEGMADLVTEHVPTGTLQRGLELPLTARSYERHVRPALLMAELRRRFDRDSEYLVYRSLLGQPQGPLLDLGCGTGIFSRRLAREAELPAIVGLDVSKPMLEEAMAQARETAVSVDFVRAEAPGLPFVDHALGAVLQVGSLELIADAPRLFLEVGRVLRPKGRYVLSTLMPSRFPGSLVHRLAGLRTRAESELKTLVAAAGLVGFERLLLPPLIVIKAEKAA